MLRHLHNQQQRPHNTRRHPRPKPRNLLPHRRKRPPRTPNPLHNKPRHRPIPNSPQKRHKHHHRNRQNPIHRRRQPTRPRNQHNQNRHKNHTTSNPTMAQPINTNPNLDLTPTNTILRPTLTTNHHTKHPRTRKPKLLQNTTQQTLTQTQQTTPCSHQNSKTA